MLNGKGWGQPEKKRRKKNTTPNPGERPAHERRKRGQREPVLNEVKKFIAIKKRTLRSKKRDHSNHESG